jgi:hypothetical protein
MGCFQRVEEGRRVLLGGFRFSIVTFSEFPAHHNAIAH